ncbi:MAG: hypothetical protein PVG27_12485 [Chloroflexota bacterium]|jgi:hypothetical protein
MRTAVAAAAAVLALLVGSAGPIVAQMNDEAIPAAFFTGTVVDGDARADEGRVVYEQSVEWSDARLPPTLRAEAAWYVYGDVMTVVERHEAGLGEEEAFAGVDLVMVVEMNVLLDGPDGDWQGTGRGIEADDRYSYYVLDGDGAYEGMHVLLRGAPGHDANGPWDEEYEGWIIESELRPLPGSPIASR